jgi:hypothetical protein
MLEGQRMVTSFWDEVLHKWVATAVVTNSCFKEKQDGMSQDIKSEQNVAGLVKNILTILASDALVVVGR